MKLYYTKLIICITVIFFLTESLFGQDSVPDELSQKLTIAENVLKNLFIVKKTKSVPSSGITGGSVAAPGIHSSYIPGYGILLTIPHMTGSDEDFPQTLTSSDEEYHKFTFMHGLEGDEEESVNEETVISRLRFFLLKYGSTIEPLSSSDKIMVVYGTSRVNHNKILANNENKAFETKTAPNISISVSKSKLKIKSIPTISMSVLKSDLDAFQTENFDESTIADRISITKTEIAGSKNLELKVLADIFKTSFNERHGGESFRIPGEVHYIKLEDFGVLYLFNITYSASATATYLSNIEELEKYREQNASKFNTAYLDFVDKLKNLLVDYGRTLTSVKPEEIIMISVTISNNFQNIPDRIDVKIEKSVLEDLDKEVIDSNEVLSRIRIIEVFR